MLRIAYLLAALLAASAACAQSYPSPVFQGLTARGCTGYAFGNGASPITCASAIPAGSVAGLAPVATSGAYTDLTGRPTLATSATVDATNASNITAGTLASARLAAGAAVANLGFTPANKAGDTFSGPVATSLLNTTQVTALSGNLNLYAGSGSTAVLGTTSAGGVLYVDGGAVKPSTDNVFTSGAAGQRWLSIYAVQYYVGAAVAGVSCSGTPTASFAVTNGIVTHC